MPTHIYLRPSGLRHDLHKRYEQVRRKEVRDEALASP